MDTHWIQWLLLIYPLLINHTIVAQDGGFFSRNMRLAHDVIGRERGKAKERANQTQTNGASLRVDAFLTSTHRMNFLSACDLSISMAVKECRQWYEHLPCQHFMRKLKLGYVCDDISLNENEVGDDITCPGTFCPFTKPDCGNNKQKHRTIDGTCNNEKYPLAGSAGRAFQRYLEPHYADCIGRPRDVQEGLPSARQISNEIYQADMLPSSNILTVLHMTYGQLIDHDTDRTPVAKVLDEDTGELVEVGCGEDGCSTDGDENRNCFPIQVPSNDGVFENCVKFVRSDSIPVDDCRASVRQQGNAITSWLDASFVYDSGQQAADNLRTFEDGLLRSVPHPVNKEFLPLMPSKNDSACRNTSEEFHCFLSGDARQNEQVGLQAIHTVFMRYHNYIARYLKEKHDGWEDEKLYQESRRILGAVWQHTIYNEYLPPLLGPEFMQHYKLLPAGQYNKQYFKGYEGRIRVINPDTANVFATAAFRFGHTQIPDKLRFSDPSLQHQEDVFFSEIFFNPTRIYYSGILDNNISGVNAVMIGQTDQSASAADASFTSQVTNHMFTDFPPHGAGTDLPARNTHRGRDHGIPGYTKWIEWCSHELENFGLEHLGLEKPYGFDDLLHLMPKHKIEKLRRIYNHVDDVDLFTGAMLEDHVLGGVVGPTFACIIAKQFYSYKVGDRFFYECDRDSLVKFSKDQLTNIKTQTIASILCATLEDSPEDPNLKLNFQKWVLLQPLEDVEDALNNSFISEQKMYAKMDLYRGETNARVPCSQHTKLNFDLF